MFRLGRYARGGRLTQVKQPLTVEFRALSPALLAAPPIHEWVGTDPARAKVAHACWCAIDELPSVPEAGCVEGAAALRRALVKGGLLRFFLLIRRHTAFSPYVAPRFPHMSQINSRFSARRRWRGRQI